MRPLACRLLMLTLALGVGCTNVYQGETTADFEIEPGTTTREDVYRAYGLPHAIATRPNGVETLVYGHVATHGLGAGLTIPMAAFEIGSARSQTDSIFIDLARNDVVIRVRQNGDEADPGRSIWPGGDGSAD